MAPHTAKMLRMAVFGEFGINGKKEPVLWRRTNRWLKRWWYSMNSKERGIVRARFDKGLPLQPKHIAMMQNLPKGLQFKGAR